MTHLSNTSLSEFPTRKSSVFEISNRDWARRYTATWSHTSGATLYLGASLVLGSPRTRGTRPMSQSSSAGRMPARLPASSSSWLDWPLRPTVSLCFWFCPGKVWEGKPRSELLSLATVSLRLAFLDCSGLWICCPFRGNVCTKLILPAFGDKTQSKNSQGDYTDIAFIRLHRLFPLKKAQFHKSKIENKILSRRYQTSIWFVNCTNWFCCDKIRKVCSYPNFSTVYISLVIYSLL